MTVTPYSVPVWYIAQVMILMYLCGSSTISVNSFEQLPYSCILVMGNNDTSQCLIFQISWE